MGVDQLAQLDRLLQLAVEHAAAIGAPIAHRRRLEAARQVLDQLGERP